MSMRTSQRPATLQNIAIIGLMVAGLAACSSGAEEEQAAAGAETNATVLDQTGQGTALQSFDVRRQGRRLQVQIADAGAGAKVIVVTARSFRGVDRADARIAYDAAFEAGNRLECGGGQGLDVFADSGTFQEEGRRSAFTNGEAAWVFRGQCG
ncbi:MAG: hypothetical protein AAFV19_02140 [Pseudomonadota bacterium]